MKSSFISSVAFTPTTGALKNVFWKNGSQAPFWLTWPLLKGYMTRLEQEGRLSVRFLNKLKLETIVRLDGALELSREFPIDVFFLSGGKTGRRPPGSDSVVMMKDYLLKSRIDENAVVLDRDTLQTTDKIDMFLKYLESLDAGVITVWVVTSWYHLPRVLYLLRKGIVKSRALSGKRISIRWKKVFPPLTSECLKYEYAYNLLVELVEYLTTDSEIIRRWWLQREIKLRNIKE